MVLYPIQLSYHCPLFQLAVCFQFCIQIIHGHIKIRIPQLIVDVDKFWYPYLLSCNLAFSRNPPTFFAFVRLCWYCLLVWEV